MIKKTVLDEVKNRIKEMKDQRASDLAVIEQKQAEARTALVTAGKAMKEATERMDIDAYEEARQAKRRAQTAIDMYSGRYTQISQQEYISEEESDKVIDSLLEYEKQLESSFETSAGDLLRQLDQLLREYQGIVNDVEKTIDTWQHDIHANYRSETGTNPKTGTNRFERPMPVHAIPYYGCSESVSIGKCLEQLKSIYAD